MCGAAAQVKRRRESDDRNEPLIDRAASAHDFSGPHGPQCHVGCTLSVPTEGRKETLSLRSCVRAGPSVEFVDVVSMM